MKKITLAITGASGAQYGFRLLQVLLDQGCEVHLLISAAARQVCALEMSIDLPNENKAILDYVAKKIQCDTTRLHLYSEKQWAAPVASGSNAPDAMVVCPCSSGTLSAIATGASDNLIERAADVMLKEQKKLILVHREMPLSVIHLEHQLTLGRLGVVIMPASPGFYHQPDSISDLIDFVVARILDHLAIENQLMQRWGADKNA